MSWKRRFLVVVIAIAASWVAQDARAGDLRIPLPKRSHLTPVQKLNRQGVEAIRKNQFDKAKALFYKAYLYDPDDPFTLNNLGYISELEGRLDRAQRFYALASSMSTNAVVDQASSPQAKGKPAREVVGSFAEPAMLINRANVEAIRLLSGGRAPEAELLLQRTLGMDPQNPFTLNNMGVAKEMEGEPQKALLYYSAAARSNSQAPIIVTLNAGWKGKPVSAMAADNASKLRQRLGTRETLEAKVARLNLSGVSAINRNDWQDARQYFLQAYNLGPDNAFSLNNRGYLAEMDGDLETASFYYEKARVAERAGVRVGVATRSFAEGMKLFEVAEDSDRNVENRMTREREARRQQQGPIQLRRRDKRNGIQPWQQPQPSSEHSQLPQ